MPPHTPRNASQTQPRFLPSALPRPTFIPRARFARDHRHKATIRLRHQLRHPPQLTSPLRFPTPTAWRRRAARFPAAHSPRRPQSHHAPAFQKKEAGLMTVQEIDKLERDLFPLQRRPDTVILAPQRTASWGIYMNKFYDFKMPGKYQIKVSKQMPKIDKGDCFAVSLGAPIEVEVKEAVSQNLDSE
jgi:hypothetical protein